MRKCKKCGKEIHSSTKKCLNCGKDQRFFLIRHPFIIICIIIIALFTIFTGKDNKEIDITEADILEKQALNSEKKETFKHGEIFVNGYLDVKYNFANLNFKKYGQYAHIKSQHKVIQAQFEFQNVSEVDRLITSDEFKCYVDGVECERFLNVSDASFSNILSAGKKIIRNIYFEVPLNAKEIKIKYENPFVSKEFVEFIVNK